MHNQIANKNISHQYKSFSYNPSMSKPKFQDNLQAIDKGAHQFHTFLSQFKSRHQRTHFTPLNLQQNISNQHLMVKSQSPRKNLSPSFYQEDLYENKSEFKHQSSGMENLGQIGECSSGIEIRDGSQGFEIRKPYKLNSTPPAKHSQQDNIKNQHPGQLIILRSAQELPHWLFEHIRKKNAGRLKNICIEQDKQRHSQIMTSSEQFQKEGDRSRARNKMMAQRYLNQAYVVRKEKEQVNPEGAGNEGIYVKSGQRSANSHNSQMDYFRKVSSSSEMSNYYSKTSRLEGRLKPQKNNKVYINDYEYSYCPDTQAEDRKRAFKSANHKSAVFEQMNGKQMHPAKKPKPNNHYRIRHDQKPQKPSHVSKTPAKRLPTVSQQLPLVEPKKFVLC